MEEKNVTAEIILILDKSGSMSGTESDTAGGFNSLIEKQKSELTNAWVTTWLFNGQTELLYDRIPIREVKPMTAADIEVGGNTALYDAVGNAIKRTELIQKHLRKEDVPDLTLVAIMTDGYENASRQYNNSEIRELIEQKKQDGWEFLFLAAGIDAKEEAERIAIPQYLQSEIYSASESFDFVDEFIASAFEDVRARREREEAQCNVAMDCDLKEKE